MGASAVVTLADFFGPSVQDLARRLELTLDTHLEAPKETLSQLLQNFGAGALSRSIASRIQELLDVDISDVLGSAWSKSKEIREAIKSTKLDSKETALVPLMEHIIESEHQPYVEILQGQKTLARVTFQVSFEIRVKSAQLRIEKGRIQEIISGEAKAVGMLKLGGVKLLEKEIEPLHITGPVIVRFEQDEGAPEQETATK